LQQDKSVNLLTSTFVPSYAVLARPKTRQACAEYVRRLAGFPPNPAVVVKLQTVEKLVSHGALGEEPPHHVRPFGLYLLARVFYPTEFKELLEEAEAAGVYGEVAPDFHERVYAELRRVVAAKQGACPPDDYGVDVIVID